MKLSKGKKTKAHTGSIRVAQGTYQRALITKLLVQIFGAIMGLFIVYLCFAATIIRVVPTTYGPILTKNNTYPGSLLPAEGQVFVDFKGEAKTGVQDRIIQSLIPQKNTGLISVVAGPTGKIKYKPFSIDGKVTPMPLGFDQNKQFLEDEYIGICLKGDCTPGATLIFRSSQVIGLPVGSKLEIPPPPAQNNSTGIDRANPQAVAYAYLARGYSQDGAGACELVSDEFLKNSKGLAGCKANAQFWTNKVGRGYDLSKLLTKLDSADDKVAKVSFTFTETSDGKNVSGSAVLVNTPKGWAINEVK